MLGGIYGDKAGSIYEYDQVKKIQSIDPEILITKDSFFSDDTIEIIAIMDAIINNKDYKETLKEYILKYENYQPDYQPYFKNSFSPNTIKWAHGIGKSNSNGNGALMRISPVGYLFDAEQDVVDNAVLATIPSHNSMESIYSAVLIARLIFYLRNGISKEKAFEILKINPSYIPFKKFNMTCGETVNNCLYAVYNSNSFEDAIRKVLLMGGDTDTNSCIVGSIVEAIYGINDKEKEDALNGLPNEFVKILKKKY